MEIKDLIKKGAIFVYPTDTVYGLGCNALDKKAVDKIKKIKGRDDKKPLSIIAPSNAWIHKYTKASEKAVNKYLPGKYTLILEKKNPKFLAHVSSNNFLGIRVPKHNFTKVIQKAGLPFITTSCNISSKKPISSLKQLDSSILKKVDVIVNCGKLSGTPSTLVMADGTMIKR